MITTHIVKTKALERSQADIPPQDTLNFPQTQSLRYIYCEVPTL